ncbi:P-loop containing nucleoside triphosphate hydrolase protein [Podospora australis]|uniref:P-loop containing nucleoside triphosphate hydrolase protein n=1 Tax=Podospora australis TaxID=1536484 RepID=A0AAN6X2M5_9PEZI|nr:P-loop containing nucleoside triphosphate hydrolase protein [Podospora australis]
MEEIGRAEDELSSVPAAVVGQQETQEAKKSQQQQQTIMDRYHQVHGHDVSSFDTIDLASTHRLPTISAADALEEVDQLGGAYRKAYISTSLPRLDEVLVGNGGASGEDKEGRGGIAKGGGLVEVWGPPGVGKTAFGIQLAADCLKGGEGVVWVDASHCVSVERLRAVIGTEGGDDDKFTHYACPTLPHFIALLCWPTPATIPTGTGLIVIDSLSALINHAFPKLPERQNAKGRGPKAAIRRFQVLQYIVSSLQKLAATRDIAIAILTQCATKMQAERSATLVPALNASAWVQGMSTRLVLFRDWLSDDYDEEQALRFVAVQKLNGRDVPVVEGDSLIFAFDIDAIGLVAIECNKTQDSNGPTSAPAAQKRKLGETDFEIADSDADDDEDYGWDDEHDELPPNPSQWQGSEDILLTRQPESEAYYGEEEQERLDQEELDAHGSDDNTG